MILHGKNACQKKPVLNKLVPSISATDTGNDKHFITRSFLEMSALVLLAMSMKENKKSTIVQSSLRQTFLFVLLLSQFLRGHVDFHCCNKQSLFSTLFTSYFSPFFIEMY